MAAHIDKGMPAATMATGRGSAEAKKHSTRSTPNKQWYAVIGKGVSVEVFRARTIQFGTWYRHREPVLEEVLDEVLV